MGLSVLTSTMTIGITWNAQNTLTGSSYSPISQSSNLVKRRSNGTSRGNDSVGGANQLASFITSVAGNGAATINLRSLTNILQTSGVSLARLKEYNIRLLSESDDTIGTACSSITVGNAASNPCPLEMGAGTMTFNIKNGGSHGHMDDSAEGMLSVDSTTCNVKILNNDTIAAKVQTTFVGGDT